MNTNTQLIILRLRSGFSNRMLPLLSCYIYCKINNIELAVIWEDNTCRSCLEINTDKYLDIKSYFKEIPNNIKIYRFLDELIAAYEINQNEIFTIGMNWCHKISPTYLSQKYILLDEVCHVLALFTNDTTLDFLYPHPFKEYPEFYRNEQLALMSTHSIHFIPIDFIMNTVTKLLNKINNVHILSIHVRVTDGGFASYNKDTMYNDVANIISSYDGKIYLATDSQDFERKILSNFDNVVVYDDNEKFTNSNSGTLHSLVDLYMLASSDVIYGTPNSSFSLLSFILNRKSHKQLKFISI